MQSGRHKKVLVLAGGGLGHVSGGVGTLMRYLMAEWARDPASLPVRVIDTRGTGGAASAVRHFAYGVAALAWGRVTGRLACAHIHMTTRGSALRKALLCALARLLGVPAILHLHGADFFEFHAGLPRPAQHALRAAVASAGCIVVIGKEWRNRLVHELGVPAHRVRIVANGVPPAPRACAAGGPVRILFLGRLGARKGVNELIQALASASLSGRPWTAAIAGDGDAAPYAAQIADAGLQERVAVPGWLDAAQAAGALANAHILVLPSHHEVMPIAILEAMARGLAIVATPVGAIPEILRDGENALLVQPGDPAGLAHALATLIDDPGLRTRLGSRALQDFDRRLDIAHPAAALQAIYRQAGTTRARGARPLAARA